MNMRSMNKNIRYLGALMAFLGSGLVAYPVSADILLATENTDIQQFNGARNLDLNGSQPGGQQITFITSAPDTLVRVIFNAVGAMRGNFSARLDSTIFIDPAGSVGPTACAPSSSNNAFISGNGTPFQLDGLVSAVTQCTYRVPTAGVHRVGVRMTPTPANQSWQIDDLSLVIDR